MNKSLTCLLLFFSIPGWASAVARAQSSSSNSSNPKTTTAIKEWKRYNLGNGRLSVLLPDDPEEQVDEQTPTAGLTLKSHTYTTNVKQGSYGVTCFILSEAADKWSESAVESFYNGVWQGVSETYDTEFKKQGISWKTNMIEKRKVQFSSYDGREITFTIGLLKGRLMMTLVGHQAFTAMVIGTEGLSIDDQEKFFKSITINIPLIKQ